MVICPFVGFFQMGIGPFPSWAPVGPEGAPGGAPRKPAAAFSSSTAAAKTPAAANPSTRCRMQQQPKQTTAAAPTGAPVGSLHKRQHLQHEQQHQQQRGGSTNPAAAAAAAAAVETLQGELQQAVLERDFYYNKLRRIEILCGTPGQETLSVQQIQGILYAKDEEPEAIDPQ